jgi:S1-C subfamily serine protease
MPPLSMFPNEGIHTRVMIAVDQNNRQTKFLETSSAGLRGQSGGPIFDSAGRVWAIQSKTLSIPLGFAPTVKQGNKELVEHQFIHIGVGCHVDEVREFLSANKVPFDTMR